MHRILIAEDHTAVRHALSKVFSEYDDWKVCGEAADGNEAVDAAVELKPDLVLLDYKMPNKDGIKAASEINQKLPETPVVIFTLNKTRQLEAIAQQVGVRAVVGKEEGVSVLLGAVDKEVGS